MNQNKIISTIPLILIVVGSTLLALPGIYGSIFLVWFAVEGVKNANFLSLLIPVPAMIGFVLLAGYYAAIFTKRFSFALWLSSAIYNFILAALSIIWGGYAIVDGKMDFGVSLASFVFGGWTSFVATSSIYYLRRSNRFENVKLP